ncbi:MAG: HEAT repeat domain-containing protein [Verrucomicrobiales bacterium]|nr:HEAT repeat domain-containing protein [Verrucomicrobiales bacterium]
MPKKRRPERSRPRESNRPDAGPLPSPGAGLPRGLVVGIAALVALAAAWLWWPKGNLGSSGAGSSGGGPGSPTAAATNFVLEPEPEAFARYAGSASCRECHATQVTAWESSHHGLAERPVSEAMDRSAFDPARTFAHGTQTTTVSWKEGRAYVEADGLSGKREALPIVRVIGHDPLRQFLVEFPGGRFQTLEASWDPRTNAWFNVYGAEDRRPGEWGHWTGRGMGWNAMCGTCHNTRFRKNYESGSDTYRSSMAEPTVGCEACHGPMREHGAWQRAWKDSGKKDPTLTKRTPAAHMESCAPCHARRGELTGDFVPGDSFWDHFVLSIVDDSDLFHPDGQIWDEDYEYSAFLGSRMHAAGVTCLDCHDPHAAKPKLAGNDLCMRCHNGSRQGSPIVDPVAHSFHKPGEAGSRCVDCHMPQTVYMQRHWRRDHGFTTPDPVLTRDFGIPNACNRCHADRDANWAIEACNRWYGPRMERPARGRAKLMATARRGDRSAVEGLKALLTGNEVPYWKASAIAMLGRWGEEPPVRDALKKALAHDHPLVRHRAIQALTPWAEAGEPDTARLVRERLRDASRGVRVSAAWALRGEGRSGEPATSELAHMLALNADQPGGQAQLAAAAAGRGAIEEAVGHYRKAVAWDPGSPGLRLDYAVALSSTGKSREALAQTLAAVRLQPQSAENHYRLGLAWAEVGDLGQAVSALEEACRRDPAHDRAAYNLGLAYRQRGETDRSVATLEAAERANPRDPRIPYARATVLMQIGRTSEARDAARRVLELEPTHPGAAELMRGPAP